MAARVIAELCLRRAGAARQALQALSDRELEVFRLIADGMPNAQIAARLVTTEKTVKSHVSNVLAKLHLDDRTQAAVFAWRHGIAHR